MGFIELLLIAVGLSMDAFAVSICKGLSVQKVKPKHAACVALYFGGFVLLALIGANMIREAFSEEETQNDSFSFRTMFMMAIATSIDALAVGVSFAMVGTMNIYLSVLLIGAITAVISCAGLYIGNFFGSRYKKPSEITGGVILILIGIKILIEHLA